MTCPSDPAWEAARSLVLRHGWNATSYQILNPGIRRWLGLENRVVVGYFEAGKRWIVAGAPIAAPGEFAAAAEAFEKAAAQHSARVCYFGADARLRSLRADRSDFSEMTLGAQPIWNPAHWPTIVARKASVRAQVHRALNKQVVVTEWPTDRAEDHPALRQCLARWLGAKHLPPMHFLVEPDTLGRLRDRRVFVAERDGVVTGFSVLSPVPARHGWLVEQIVRSPASPNGTAALLLDAAMRQVAREGAGYLTLGLSPLSERATASHPNPLWLRLLIRWLRAYGRRFYNFEGLERFKAKFLPDRWDPITAVTNEPAPSMRTLYAIADAFSGEGVTPLAFVGQALGAALRQEVRAFRG